MEDFLNIFELTFTRNCVTKHKLFLDYSRDFIEVPNIFLDKLFMSRTFFVGYSISIPKCQTSKYLSIAFPWSSTPLVTRFEQKKTRRRLKNVMNE